MNRKDGITLITLVITIIVLLILAGVILNVVVGENGILSKAQDAKLENDYLNEKEKILYSIFGTIDYENVKFSVEEWNIDYIYRKLGSDVVVMPKDELIKVEFLKTGNKYMADKTGNIYSLISLENAIGVKFDEMVAVEAKQSVMFLPSGYVISGIETENDDINHGIVIYEVSDTITEDFWTKKDNDGLLYCQTNYNQFVWVPVSDINNIAICQLKTADSQCNIEKDKRGKLFCTEHKTDRLCGKVYSSGTGENFDSNYTAQIFGYGAYIEPYLVTADNDEVYYKNTLGFDSKNDFELYMKLEFENMLNSVHKYKGFYFARYELSIENGLAQSKKNKKPATAKENILWYGLYNIQRKYYSNQVQGGMMFGCQWDAVLIWALSGEDASHVTANNNAIHSASSMYLTGKQTVSDKFDKINNIFDMEGNVREFSLEALNGSLRCARGGYYGTINTPGNKNWLNPTTASDIRGSRMNLYIK